MTAHFPTARKTQTDIILDWLFAGNSLTPLESRYPPFNCLSLSQRVRTAARGEYDGVRYPIISEPFHTESGKVVAKYSMPSKPFFPYG
jgi:hypothetical protein